MSKELENLVQCAIEERWKEIDEMLVPSIIQNYTTNELFDGLYNLSLFEHENENVRDLAGTLASNLNPEQLSEENVDKIYQTLHKGLDDTHLAVKLWSSIALINLKLYAKDSERIRAVLEDINERGDDYQKNLASKYLANLEK